MQVGGAKKRRWIPLVTALGIKRFCEPVRDETSLLDREVLPCDYGERTCSSTAPLGGAADDAGERGQRAWRRTVPHAIRAQGDPGKVSG